MTKPQAVRATLITDAKLTPSSAPSLENPEAWPRPSYVQRNATVAVEIKHSGSRHRHRSAFVSPYFAK